MEGIVLTKNADLFEVESENKIYSLKPSGKTKAGGIFVGDYVNFNETITQVKKRKNLLIRPPVANIDKMLIVLAPIPKPDFALIDKMLIYCKLNDIIPIIVVNKFDICDDDFINNIKIDYEKNYKLIFVSAKQRKIEELKNEIYGITVLAGQSAVGKSSLINALFESENLAVIGELSKKTDRGKQTTRLVKLYKIDEGYIADTAGFSLLDLSFISAINSQELSSYYPDFLKGISKCKYRSCLHENDKDCGVIKELKNNKISMRRYQNYLKILNELKIAENNKFKNKK